MKKQEITRRGGCISAARQSDKKQRHKTGPAKIMLCLCLCLVLFLGGFFQKGSAASYEEDSGAQLASLNPTRPGAGYSAVLYDNQNGLPTSEANAIVQTEEGFIWIGSYSGLIRYDGNTFERLDSTTGIASVVSLFVDSKNRLWVGTNDGGVVVIENGLTRTFRIEDGLKSLSVRSITEDKAGNIYVGTTRGVAKIDAAMKVQTIEKPQIKDSYIRKLVADESGYIYGITQEGALFTIEDGTLGKFIFLKEEGIPGIVSVNLDPYREGYVYLGSSSSDVYYVNIKATNREYEKINVAPLTCIDEVINAEDTLWFCANNGIGLMAPGGQLSLLDTVPMNNSVDHMIADYQNNLWFTSSRQGVMKITQNRFADVFDWYGLNPMVVNSTCAYNDYILFGTDSGLTVVSEKEIIDTLKITEAKTFSGKKIPQTNLVDMLKGCRIRSVIRDSKNRIWFSTYSEDYGLVCYDDGHIVCYTEADGMPSSRMRSVTEFADGTIHVACTGGMAVINEQNGTIKTYDEEIGLSNTEILTIAEASNGECVIGTDGGGIYVIGNAVVRSIDTSSGLTSDVVMRIKSDPEREIFWIVTSNSIAYMDKFYRVRTIRNFPYSNNFDMYENSKGEMWILSSNGVYVVDTEQLLQNEIIEPDFYNRENGLPCVATANSYSELTPEGDLYIAGSTGVAKVNIEEEFENVTDIKMAVPYVTADGEAVYPDANGVIRIKADVKKVVIQAHIFSYTLTNPQVTYWLEGFDHRKTTVSRTGFGPVTYTNLQGRSYVFHMEIQDASGQVKTYTIRIIKNKMFYEFWWFKVISVLILSLILFWIVVSAVRKKIQALVEKEQEQKTFINEMIEAFAKTIDMKDNYTNGHSFRVAKYTAMLAKELGYNDEDIEKYHNIALLHDIGKIGVEDKVLKKEGKLEDDEFMQIKSHAARGADVLKDISIMPELAIGAGAHHERPDGKGYPNGLKGDEIPRVAQIIAVADTFDAMYSDRPYRKRMNFEKAVSIIKGAAGTQLTEDVVEAFLRLVDKGEFRAPDDIGGGTTEDIDNIHKKEAEAAKAAEAK